MLIDILLSISKQVMSSIKSSLIIHCESTVLSIHAQSYHFLVRRGQYSCHIFFFHRFIVPEKNNANDEACMELRITCIPFIIPGEFLQLPTHYRAFCPTSHYKMHNVSMLHAVIILELPSLFNVHRASLTGTFLFFFFQYL